MRRMTTTKELNYIKDLEQVAEKGFQVGTYPDQIYIVPEENPNSEFQPSIVDGELNWQWIQEQIGVDINLENHTFGSSIQFYLPHLMEKYGLYEDNLEKSPAYIMYVLNNSITIPNSVVDFNSLKTWMQSEAFINAINETGYDFDEAMIKNHVATYNTDDPADNIVLVNGELKLNTYIVCDKGLGEEIVNATDPVGEPALKVENLQVENLETENINGIPLFSGTIQEWALEGYNIKIKQIKYITLQYDLTQAQSPWCLALYSDDAVIGSDYSSFNTNAPQYITLKSMNIGDNSGTYGITNTEIHIGGNVYVFDDISEESYVLQGTFKPIASSFTISIRQNHTGEIHCYNS